MFAPKPAIYGAKAIRVSRRFFGPRLGLIPGEDDVPAEGRQGPGIMTGQEWTEARERELRRFADLERRFQGLPAAYRPPSSVFSARAFQLRTELQGISLRTGVPTIAQEDLIMFLAEELDRAENAILDAEERRQAMEPVPAPQPGRPGQPAAGTSGQALPKWAVPAAVGVGVLVLIGLFSA